MKPFPIAIVVLLAAAPLARAQDISGSDMFGGDMSGGDMSEGDTYAADMSAADPSPMLLPVGTDWTTYQPPVEDPTWQAADPYAQPYVPKTSEVENPAPPTDGLTRDDFQRIQDSVFPISGD